MTASFPLVPSSLRPLVLGPLPPFVLSLSKDSWPSRPFRLTRSRKAAKGSSFFFAASRLRVQNPSVFRFNECAS